MIKFREHTWDENIWRSVVDHDEYRLGGLKLLPEDVVLDIGAHIGSFAYLALDRGAGRVVAVEPDPDNFNYLRHNLQDVCRAAHRTVLVSGAAWSMPGKVHYAGVGVNTGGGTTLGCTGVPVAAFPFPELLEWAASMADSGKIRLLKLDCEGAEWPLLMSALETSDQLDRVEAIVGEYHYLHNLLEWPEAAKGLGFPDTGKPSKVVCDYSYLITLLKEAGFQVETDTSPIGRFRAWRIGREPWA